MIHGKQSNADRSTSASVPAQMRHAGSHLVEKLLSLRHFRVFPFSKQEQNTTTMLVEMSNSDRFKFQNGPSIVHFRSVLRCQQWSCLQ